MYLKLIDLLLHFFSILYNFGKPNLHDFTCGIVMPLCNPQHAVLFLPVHFIHFILLGALYVNTYTISCYISNKITRSLDSSFVLNVSFSGSVLMHF